MTNEKYMIAEILKIEPDAVYMDKVYGYYVTVKLQNGEVLCLFDPDMKCKEEYIGKKVNILIGLFINASIEKSDFFNLKIYECGCTGKVEKIIKTDYVKVLLDVGIGKVMVGAPGLGTKIKNVALDYSDLKVGDYLKIEGTRFDLEEIELIEEN